MMKELSALKTPTMKEDRPSNGSSILYSVFGYGCCAIGQSGNGESRSHSTVRDKNWAEKFIWIDLNDFGIYTHDERKHLEAIVIYKINSLQEKSNRRIIVKNIQYTVSLGKYSHAHCENLEGIADLFIEQALDYAGRNPDFRGNRGKDIDIFLDEKAAPASKEQAARRIENGGANDDLQGAVRVVSLRKLKL